MDRPNIQGHCTWEALRQFDRMLMFSAYGMNYAFVDTGDGPMEVMLLLVVSNDDYEAWAEFFCR